MATVVTALLLAACSSTGTPSTGGATASGSPRPTDAASSAAASPVTAPSSAQPTPIDTQVVLWCGTGGIAKLGAVINSAARVEAQHAGGSGVIDLSQVSKDIYAARQYRPLPDPETQAAWTTALQHLANGLDSVLSVSDLKPHPSIAPELAKEKEAQGWEEYATGVAGLKDVDSRILAFGCLRDGDPWHV
ncbi:hypothetical protein AB0K51_07580 [Kitasatospora sp. NPDC049285]|uniref:hypothetical protein n=1 Tax=Kitasatospora sp. NPDC049285 TaxID=3157096 RepID=UPI00344176E0